MINLGERKWVRSEQEGTDKDRILFAKTVAVEALFQAAQIFLPFFFSMISEITMFYTGGWWTFSIKSQSVNVRVSEP